MCFTSPNAAYVVNPSDGNRIFIYSKSLNRALPNDIVAVKLNDIEHWRVRLIFNYLFHLLVCWDLFVTRFAIMLRSYDENRTDIFKLIAVSKART